MAAHSSSPQLQRVILFTLTTIILLRLLRSAAAFSPRRLLLLRSVATRTTPLSGIFFGHPATPTTIYIDDVGIYETSCF